MARTISLPHDWSPRPHQLPAFRSLDNGVKNLLSIWHRRSGKDNAAINITAQKAHERTGVYWHMFPTLKQGKQALWEGIDHQGRNIVDQAFPPDLVKRKRNDEMLLELKCGSIWRILGADNFDTNVGANPVGVVMSEAALQSPLAAQYIRPILVDNGGWMWLNTTPRGKNYIWDIYSKNKDNPEWHVDKFSILDTGLVTPEQVRKEIESGMTTAARAQQEYYCDFNAADEGSIYGQQIELAEKTQRIGFFPYDPRYPVETSWDVGLLDATAIVFAQRIGSEIRIIDFYMNVRQALPHYAGVIHSRPYSYSRHIWPHDTDRVYWGSGTKTIELANAHGLMVTVAPKSSVDAGIEAVRVTLPRMTFNIASTNQLVSALKQYHREWDEDDRVFSKPAHDWSSDPCDALRYLCVTPQSYGIIPDWARTTPIGQQIGQIGHNGGPPMHSELAKYDPLAGWRSNAPPPWVQAQNPNYRPMLHH